MESIAALIAATASLLIAIATLVAVLKNTTITKRTETALNGRIDQLIHKERTEAYREGFREGQQQTEVKP